MNKYGRFLFYLVLCAGLLGSCKKKLDKNAVSDNLKTAMAEFLNHRKQLDTTKVKFTVVDVAYFEAPELYICQFKVNLKDFTKTPMQDTTGIMNASVTKDFRMVRRKD
jgi:hypothetical protein